MWSWLLACATPPTPCGTEECAEVCAAVRQPAAAPAPGSPPTTPSPPPSAPSRSEFEDLLVAATLDDVRAGVRPWGDDALGVCVGKKECKEFLGTDAGQLAAGDHLVKAELRVPAVGEKGTWKVRFETECTSEGAEPVVSRYAREYDVTYAGPDRGFRLMPLRMIESPSKDGAQSCRWTLTAPHPQGDASWSGSWSVPGR
jgi:hypothetical protein